MNNKKKFKNSYKLFEKSKRFIPLAAQTFSKSSMNFVFGASPLFISRGKGAFTWDIDNNKFIDYLLGLLPIILGHCDKDVDDAIKNQLKKQQYFHYRISLNFSLQSNFQLLSLVQKILDLQKMDLM